MVSVTPNRWLGAWEKLNLWFYFLGEQKSSCDFSAHGNWQGKVACLLTF
ncbi:MAG: hypothetical protein MRERV_28c023 [Mycoplasmataceae bacterium RV_VA103A]|nr:MAG: hypothetical protein MRERV_28c023 [Mycoplasmataceae bacterium RV_VA103A]